MPTSASTALSVMTLCSADVLSSGSSDNAGDGDVSDGGDDDGGGEAGASFTGTNSNALFSAARSRSSSFTSTFST